MRKIARTSDLQFFKDSQFPKSFDKTAQEACTESTERFTKMLEDRAKYLAFMNAVGAPSTVTAETAKIKSNPI